MSQYQPPYSGPPHVPSPMPGGYGWNPYDDLLGPARRASTLMMILGSLGLVCGLCFGLGRAFWSHAQFTPEQLQRFEEMEGTLGLPIQTVLLALAIMVGLPSLLLLVAGYFVRGGGKVAVYISLVLVGLLNLLLGLEVLRSIVLALAYAGQAPQAMGNLCITVVFFALFVLLLVWLIQAARAAGQIDSARAQYEAQYWQYYQQQQRYGQPPPGGPAQPPPPPPPPPPEQQP